MTDEIELAERFEGERPRLRGIAMRMLGSSHAADDAVQEAWLRLVRTDKAGEQIENLPGWLTTVVSRICLDVLRSRTAHREEAWPDETDFVDTAMTPEEEVELVDAVGQAMTVVLDTLSPAERLAYVLRDVFAVPFEQIAPVLGRSEVATRQLASRARRRLREPEPREDLAAADAAVVDAFMQASRDNDFAALLDLLDPEATVRVDDAALAMGGDARRGPGSAGRGGVLRGPRPRGPAGDARRRRGRQLAVPRRGQGRVRVHRRGRQGRADRGAGRPARAHACGPTLTVPIVSVASASTICAEPGHLLLELGDPGLGQPAQRLDGDRHLPAGALLVPDAGHLAVDEQHGVVAGLARRHQGPLPRAAREQQVPRPAADDVRVEVRQQPHALGGRSRRTSRPAGRRPARRRARRGPGPGGPPSARTPTAGVEPNHGAKLAGVAGP